MSDAAQPHATAMEWITNSAQASADVVQGLDWSTYGVWGGIAVALGVASRYAHLLGPIGTVAGEVVGRAVNLVYPKAKQEANRKAQVMEQTAWQIVEGIESLPDTEEARRLKKFIKDKTPDEFEALFAQWKREHQRRQAAKE